MKGTSSWSKLNSGLESPRLKSENISTSKKSNGASAVSFGTVVDCLYIDEQRQGEINKSGSLYFMGTKKSGFLAHNQVNQMDGKKY